MEASELRIGNLVDYAGDTVEVEGMKYRDEKGYQRVYLKTGGAKKDFLSPILITEEWLIKFGLEKDEGDVFHTKWFKCFINPNGILCLVGYENNHQNIKYVHQLQNLYFALTGEELTT